MFISINLICCLLNRYQSRGCKKTVIKGTREISELYKVEIFSIHGFWWRGFFVFDNNCREEDECEDANTKFNDRSLRNQSSNGDTDESTRCYSSEVRILFNWFRMKTIFDVLFIAQFYFFWKDGDSGRRYLIGKIRYYHAFIIENFLDV